MIFGLTKLHCIKYRNFANSPGVEILWESTVPAEFSQNFHIRKLDKVSLFCAVLVEYFRLLVDIENREKKISSY